LGQELLRLKADASEELKPDDKSLLKAQLSAQQLIATSAPLAFP